MKVKILKESGFDEAVLGFSLSYNSTIDRATELFPTMAFKQGGHNKFLESIMLWLDVTAPRFWWQEADTYRISTKQSESTIHTLVKRKGFTEDDFEYGCPRNTLFDLNDLLWEYRTTVNNEIKDRYYMYLKNNLPEGFLQRRIWVMSYKTLQNIIQQRKFHKLPQWKLFIDSILEQAQHPEFLDKDK